MFDLEQGMWLGLMEKFRTKVALGYSSGLKDKDHDMKIVFQYEMEWFFF